MAKKKPRGGLPHPIPYQGSKRLLAGRILDIVREREFLRFFEPFAGSAAITIAAASRGLAKEFVISDSLEPLIGIWLSILNEPQRLCCDYERIWKSQDNVPEHYNRVRDRYNKDPNPAELLYLLARCVKNSPRFNKKGEFNQSHDRRRRGRCPSRMRKEVMGASALLSGISSAMCCDFDEALSDANKGDVVYMDPPYQGVSGKRDTRYRSGLDREVLVNALDRLVSKDIPVILSYDGRCGDKSYGEDLPKELGLIRFDVKAGRSAQATLNGSRDETVESLYVSPSLVQDASLTASKLSPRKPRQGLLF